MDLSSRGEKFRDESLSPSLSQGYDSNNDVQGYTGQGMASAMKAKIMETLPIENRSRSDIACPLAALMFAARGSERVQRESRNAHRVPKRAARLSRVGAARRTSRSGWRRIAWHEAPRRAERVEGDR